MPKWINKQTNQTICCLQETHFRFKDTHRLKVKRWQKTLHVNENEKKAEVAMLLSDKIDFYPEYNTRQRRSLYNTKGQSNKRI